MQENTALIKEINELRREIRSLRARVATGGTSTGEKLHWTYWTWAHYMTLPLC